MRYKVTISYVSGRVDSSYCYNRPELPTGGIGASMQTVRSPIAGSPDCWEWINLAQVESYKIEVDDDEAQSAEQAKNLDKIYGGDGGAEEA